MTYTEFGQCVAIDFLERSKTPNARGYTALLVMVDQFSNYVVAIPVKSTGAEEAARVIVREWIQRLGVMKSIRHDLGSAFTSKLFQAMLKMFDIQSKHGVAWHSQANGLCEAMNKRINTCIRTCLTPQQQMNFDQWIGYITFTMNCLKSSKTKHTANFLVFSRELAAPRDLFVVDNERTENAENELCDTREKQIYETYMKIQKVTREAVKSIQEKAKYMKAAYDKHVHGPFFEEGQYCMLLVKPAQHKWLPRFEGPYLITEKLSDHNYIVQTETEKKLVNITKMKLYKKNKYSTNEKVKELRKEESIPKNVTTKMPEDNVESSSSSSSSDDEDWELYSFRRSTCNTTSSVPAASSSVRSQEDEQDPFTTASSGAEIEEHAEVTQPIGEIRDTDPVSASTPIPAERRTSSRERKPMERLNYNRLGGPKETRGQPDNDDTITEVTTDGSDESQPETLAIVTTERLPEIANEAEERQLELEMMTDESDESEPELTTNATEESHTKMTTDEEGQPDLPTAVQLTDETEAGPSIPAPVKIEPEFNVPGKPLKKPIGKMDLAYIAGASKRYTPEEKINITKMKLYKKNKYSTNEKVKELRKEESIPKNVTTKMPEDNVESSSSSSSSDDEDWELYSFRRSTCNTTSSVPAASSSVRSQEDEQDPFTTASSGAEIEEHAEVTQPIGEIRDTDPVSASTPIPAERRTSSRERKPMERLNYNRLGGPKETRGQPDNDDTITEVTTDGSDESQPETLAIVTTERLPEIANEAEERQLELEMMTDESDESEPELTTNATEESHTKMTTDEEGQPDLPTAVQLTDETEAGPSIPAPVKIEPEFNVPGKPLKKPKGMMDLAYIAGASKRYTPEEKVMLRMYRAEKARRKRLEKKQELKTGFSGGETQTVKQQLMSLKQSSTESITSFCANIEEKARLSYGNMEEADDIALLVLLRGLRNRDIKQKLNEASLTSYEEGMRLALKLETVNNLINGEPSTDVLQAGEAREDSFSRDNQNRWRSSERYRDNSRGRNDRSRHRSRTPSNPKKGKQMIVTGHIEKTPLNILLDTGAGASLISTRTVYQLGKQDKIQPTQTIIRGLSKTNLLPKGEIYLKIAVAKMDRVYNIYHELFKEFKNKTYCKLSSVLQGTCCPKRFVCRR
eukprot:sb/3461306/